MPFRSLLARSLELLSRELPWAYRGMCETLGRRSIAVTVDNSRLSLWGTGTELHLHGPCTDADVDCVTSRATILALLDARLTLTEAVLRDAMWLRGSVANLLAFHDGLACYLGGAVRSPSFIPLLADYRASHS